MMAKKRKTKFIIASCVILLGMFSLCRWTYPSYLYYIPNACLKFILLFNDVNKQDSMGQTALHYCAMFDDSSRLKYLIFMGGDITIKDKFDQTPLDVAGLNNSERSIELLLALERGKKVRPRSHPKNEALNSLSIHGASRDLIENIINNGADVNEINASGKTALYYSIWNENREVFLVLLENGADVFHSAVNQKCPFEAAMMMKDKFYFDTIIDKIPISKQDDFGETFLHKAAAHGEVSLAKILIEKGADPKLKNDEGETALDVAEFFNMPEEDIVVYLKSLEEK